jgi:hypothetical protein
MRTGEDVCGRGRERIEQNRVQRIENRQQTTENKEKRKEKREKRNECANATSAFCVGVLLTNYSGRI